MFYKRWKTLGISRDIAVAGYTSFEANNLAQSSSRQRLVRRCGPKFNIPTLYARVDEERGS